jgi:predicted RNase H-like nuclease (RuvC/YqgF family)
MKREELEKLGVSKEQIESIMAAYGKSITELKTQNEGLNGTVEQINQQNLKLQAEFADFKKSKMSEEERRQTEIKEQEASRKLALDEARKAELQYKTLIKKTKVKELLVNGGISGQDAEMFIDGLVGDTEENSIQKAKTFVDYVTAQKQTAATKAIEEAAKSVPQPQQQTTPVKTDKTFDPKPVW